MIKGITVTLYERVQKGTDDFGRPIYEENGVDIDDVLVSPSSSDDIVTSQDLTGKKAVYTVAIPKGDTHEWKDRRIRFFGTDWHSFGFELEGIEENIPLRWNRKVMVERYG